MLDKRLLAVFCLLGVLAVPVMAQTEEEWKARADLVLTPYKQLLQQALANGLQQGPVDAITACNVLAPALTQNLNTDAVQLGRASHRPRNPENALQPWMVHYSETFESGTLKRGQVVLLDDRTTAYVEPIFMGESCMQCHGDQIAPEVAAKINALYPKDQASGFGLGDYRGFFWVKFFSKKTVVD